MSPLSLHLHQRVMCPDMKMMKWAHSMRRRRALACMIDWIGRSCSSKASAQEPCGQISTEGQCFWSLQSAMPNLLKSGACAGCAVRDGVDSVNPQASNAGKAELCAAESSLCCRLFSDKSMGRLMLLWPVGSPRPATCKATVQFQQTSKFTAVLK